MKCLVTGGAGFIGGHLVERLLEEGHEVSVVDNLSTGSKDNLRQVRSKVPLFIGDITNVSFMNRVTKGIDLVFHLAAMNRAIKSIEDPLLSNKNNILGTLVVLEACRKNGVKKVVFSSSSSIYGGKEGINLEEDKPSPQHPYAIGKISSEYYCLAYQRLYGLRITILRYCSVYGPRQRGDIPYAAVIPNFIDRISKGKTITVYGDGNQTRNFTYVGDTVEATILAMSEKADGEVINIASNREYSVNDIISVISRITKKKPKIEYKPRLQSDPASNQMDILKAHRVLGFTSRYDLKRGLEEMIKEK